MSLQIIIPGALVLSIVAFSFGYALADYRQQRAEWARQQQQETDERNTR